MVALSFFGISIYRYGIFYAIAFIVGYIWLIQWGKSPAFSSYPTLQKLLVQHTDDILFRTMIGVLVGGRLGDVLIYEPGYFWLHPLEIIAIWHGGMSFIGGFIGVSVTWLLLYRQRKLTKKDLFMLGDLVMPVMTFGIMLGRIGNFLNQELYGVVITTLPNWLAKTATTLGLTHVYPHIDSVLRLNTNIISSLTEGLLLCAVTTIFLVKMIYRKKRYSGKILAIFLIGYSVIRFLLEYVRQDSQSEFVGWFSRSQYFFFIGLLVGIRFLYYSLKHPYSISTRQTANHHDQNPQ